MAVVLRLSRAGTHKAPFYHVVATDSRKPRDGRYLEDVGTYDPTKDPEHINLRMDRIEYWISKGAVPSETVAQVLLRARDRGAGTGAAPVTGGKSEKKAAPRGKGKAKEQGESRS